MPAVEEPPVLTVAKKKPSQKPPVPAADKQVNFRANPRLWTRLEGLADGYGLDVSNFVRLVLNEKLGEYEDRAKKTGIRLSYMEDGE